MKRIRFSVLATALLLLPAVAFAADDGRPEITVTGTAEVKVVPDEFVLTTSVESRNKTIQEATTANDQTIAKVLDFLKSSGIPETGIRTDVFRIEPMYRRDDRRKTNANGDPFQTTGESESSETPLTPIGYVVKRQISIRSSKLDQFESLYRGLIERGVNEVDGISFQTSELREHRDLARIHAIRAAKEKATALAGELGAKLTGVQTIRETIAGYPNYGMQNSSADPFGDANGNLATIAAGQIHISASVEVVFRLGSTEFE